MRSNTALNWSLRHLLLKLKRLGHVMVGRARKIGPSQLVVLTILSILFVVAPAQDDCAVLVKRNFTSSPTRERTMARDDLPLTTLAAVAYGDHPNDLPAFEQLTLTLHTQRTDQKARPCVRVEDEHDGTQLRITIEGGGKGTELGSEFAASLQQTRETLPQNSTFESIESIAGDPAVSLLIRLSRTAPYRFHSMDAGPGKVFFVLHVRSYRAEWTAMDPMIVRRVFGGAAPSRVEYRLPSAASDQTTVQIPVRATRARKTQELSVAIPNAPARLQDEEFLARQLRALLATRPAEVLPALEADTTDPVAGADYDRLTRRAEAIRRRSGPAARHRYIFARLEAFAREKPSKKNITAYLSIERDYGNAEGTLDDRYLLHLFANFASAKLAAVNSASTRPFELPTPGAWTSPAAVDTVFRCPVAGAAEPIFDEPIWTWRQQPAAVAYDVSPYRGVLHTRETGEVFNSDDLRRKYGRALRLEIAGTYTTPDNTVACLAARDGAIVGFLPRAWDGAVIIRNGRVHITSLSELTEQTLGGNDTTPLRIFNSPTDFVRFIDLVRERKLTFLQGHLLTLRGKFDARLNNTTRARRRLLVASTSKDRPSLTVVDFAPSRETTLHECARWITRFDDTATAINLDMGGWDYGRVYTPTGDALSLAIMANSEQHLSNKLAFFQ